MLLFGSALAYSTLLVYAAKEARLWHTTALKATVYWFVGTAVVLITDAVTRASPRDRDFIRSVLKRVVGITILVELVVNLYAVPLAGEVLGVGILVTFSMMQAAPSTTRRPTRASAASSKVCSRRSCSSTSPTSRSGA